MQSTSIFILQHVVREDEADENVKFIGAYSSLHEAQSAIARLLGQPGFREYPAGFHVDEYQLDQDHWTEGFGSGSCQSTESAATRSA